MPPTRHPSDTESAEGDRSPVARPRNLQEELGKQNPFDLTEEEAYLNLVRTADRLSGELRALFTEHELSEPLYNVLRIVAARKQAGIPSQSIAKDMVCRDPDVTRLVDRLCRAGWVERDRSDTDRRVVMVRITDPGQQLLARLRPESMQRLQALFGALSPKQIRQLSDLLFALRHRDPRH